MANNDETEADLTGVAARTKAKPSVEKIGDRKLSPAMAMIRCSPKAH
jgi:methionine-gamma-lyase